MGQQEARVKWQWSLMLGVAVVASSLAVGYWTGIAIAGARNSAEFSERPELENWADPYRGIEGAGVTGAIVVATIALVATLGVIIALRRRRSRSRPA